VADLDARLPHRYRQRVARFPFELLAVDLAHAAAFEEDDHLPALPAVPSRPAPGRQLLNVEAHGLQRPVGELRMEVPAEPALRGVLPRLGLALDDEQRFGPLGALGVPPGEQRPVERHGARLPVPAQAFWHFVVTRRRIAQVRDHRSRRRRHGGPVPPVVGVVLTLLVAVPHRVEPRIEGERDPLAGLVALIEVLVLHPSRLDGQQDHVARPPIGPPAIDHRGAAAPGDEQRQPALVNMHPAVCVDLVAEADPVRVGQVGSAEMRVEPAATLPVEFPLLLHVLDVNETLCGPLPAGLPATEDRRQSHVCSGPGRSTPLLRHSHLPSRPEGYRRFPGRGWVPPTCFVTLPTFRATAAGIGGRVR
jgi:hypothetical protein